MGIFFRKRITRGPISLNLSKSGVAVSVGPPHVKVGVGPNGAHLSAAASGVYYRENLTSEEQSGSDKAPPPAELKAGRFLLGCALLGIVAIGIALLIAIILLLAS